MIRAENVRIILDADGKTGIFVDQPRSLTEAETNAAVMSAVTDPGWATAKDRTTLIVMAVNSALAAKHHKTKPSAA